MEKFDDPQAFEPFCTDMLLLIVVGGVRIHQAGNTGRQEVHNRVVAAHVDGNAGALQMVKEMRRIRLDFHILRAPRQEPQPRIDILRDEWPSKYPEQMWDLIL